VTGVEIGGSVKNVIALANGIAAGMGLGENSQASLITRGLAEMTRLGVALGADPLTFSGLAGVGDLLATCTSPLSRNRTFGYNLGTGMTVAEATEAMKQTSEGVKSCRAILDLAQANGVDMPITEQIVGVVHDDRSPRDMLNAFMARSPKAEPGARTAAVADRTAGSTAEQVTLTLVRARRTDRPTDPRHPRFPPTSAQGPRARVRSPIPSVAGVRAGIRPRPGWWHAPTAEPGR